MRPFPAAEAWAARVLAEFFAQGDRERREGLPVSPLMDAATTSLPGSQASFIDFVVAPLFHQVARCSPGRLAPFMAQLWANRAAWHGRLVAEIEAGGPAAGPGGGTPSTRAAEVDKATARWAAFQKTYAQWAPEAAVQGGAKPGSLVVGVGGGSLAGAPLLLAGGPGAPPPRRRSSSSAAAALASAAGAARSRLRSGLAFEAAPAAPPTAGGGGGGGDLFGRGGGSGLVRGGIMPGLGRAPGGSVGSGFLARVAGRAGSTVVPDGIAPADRRLDVAERGGGNGGA